MTDLATKTRAGVIPGLRYRNAPAAIEFLCNAFGFERHLVVPGENGTIVHAQLSFGNGMIMLGSASNKGDYGRWIQPPSGPGRVGTHGVYVVVADADAHHARAAKAGAEILRVPTNQDYGGRDYSCRDPEGYVWTFGTYDPWA
jgi:uncharacterized glyoxalase superfamily protein PhnB